MCVCVCVFVCVYVCVCGLSVPAGEREKGGWTPQECFFDNKFPQLAPALLYNFVCFSVCVCVCVCVCLGRGGASAALLPYCDWPQVYYALWVHL